MESEKVKEIKKALEERTQHKPINCNYSEYVEACGMYCRHRREYMGTKNGQTCKNCSDFIATGEVKEYADILTLISELETENEKLMKLQSRGGYRVAELGIENQQLKDRIAELEDEIECIGDVMKQNSELQKQVDELKQENSILSITVEMHDEVEQQAIKDTAKEICDLILEHWQGHDLVECDWLIVAISEKYGVDMK